MSKYGIAFLAAVVSLAVAGTSARSEVIRYQCTDGEGPFPIIVDTNAKTVMLGEPDMEPGRAVITASTISITLNSDPSYHGRINRKTGALTTSEGNGTCTAN